MDSIYASLPHPDDFEEYLNENKELYFNLCYTKIKDNFEGDKLETVELMTFTFEDDESTVYDITVSQEDFILNLWNCLKHYEEIEDYPTCTNVNKLIKDISEYYGL